MFTDRFKLFLCSIFCLISVHSFGQEESLSKEITEAKFKALYIMNFAKYVDWPPENLSDTFHITVVNDSLLSEKLMEVAHTKKVKGLPLKVLAADHMQELGVPNIIYVNGAELEDPKQAMEFVEGRCILLVSSEVDIQHSMINLVRENSNLKYSINKSNLESCDLKAQETLYNLAVEIVE